MIIAIDGPAASGKSSTARAVARSLGFRHLDSGALYRALTLAALRRTLPPDAWDDLDEDAVAALDVTATPTPTGFRFLPAGVHDEGALRTPEVNAHVSHIARVPGIRAWTLRTLRGLATDHDVVADGRDMGTVVFPDARLKVFMVASPRERARRRLLEQGHEQPDAARLEAETERLAERDRIDSERAIAPLRRAPDAVDLDTTGLDFDAQVARIIALARARGAP